MVADVAIDLKGHEVAHSFELPRQPHAGPSAAGIELLKLRSNLVPPASGPADPHRE